MSTGVYEIVNAANGKRYVGSAATSFAKRWGVHRARLRKGTHHSRHLQASWNKHGADSFVFTVLLVCKPEQVVMYEQIAIDALKPEYNVSPTAGSPLGVKRSATTRARVSASLKGHRFNAGIPKSVDHKAKLSALRKGVPNEKNRGNKSRSGMKTDPEIVARQSAKLKETWARRLADGYRPSPEAVAKQSASLRATLAAKRRSKEEQK